MRSRPDRTASSLRDVFDRVAARVTKTAGSPSALGIAVVVIVLWALTGPVFAFSDTWQLVINTGTTIVTFLMVFLIQTTQNRDSEALHLKLGELIRAASEARDEFITVEYETHDVLEERARELAEFVEGVDAATSVEGGRLRRALAELTRGG